MATQYDPTEVIIQMHHELENARRQINLLTNQNQQSAEELTRWKNPGLHGTFVPQNDIGPPQTAALGIGPLPPPPVRPPAYNLVPNNIQPGAFNLVPQVPPTHVPAPTVQTQFVQINGEAASSARHEADIAQPNDPVTRRLKLLEEQNERVLSLLAKLPGAATPIDVEPRTGFQASPFVDEIALIDVPKKYNIPAFTPKYSGITDPVEHVAQYKQLMWTTSIPHQFQEVYMCKSFGATLTGATLQWLISLKPKTIGSFAELVNQFTRQFASSRKMEKQTSDLYYIVQKTGETIRSYFNRFNAEMINVRNCDIKTAIEAYKRGLDDTSGLYEDLTKYPPENFDDV
jgi:hypothetical protein